MTISNIFELVSWCDKCVNRIHEEMLIEIRYGINNTLTTRRFRSKGVDKVWYANYDHAFNLIY